MDWRILVLGVDGAAKPTITSSDQVAGIDSLQLDPTGSCGEAALTAIPGAIDLEPRDVITVQYSLDGFATVKGNLYRGYITSAGTTRGSRLQRYRAMGLKQRAYEVVLQQLAIAGGDVSTMAKALFDGPLAPGQIVGADTLLGALPVLGFQLGPRYPRLETAGDTLDALADAAGSFIVPTATTYTYAGRTFAEGERVPAVRWGATATGRWFFHRPLGELTLDERARRVRVDWQPRDAEEIADRVTLVYASDYNGNPIVQTAAGVVTTPAAQPLAFTAGAGDYNAGAVRVLEAPLDFMTDAITSTLNSGFTNPGNAFDGNPTTFAEVTGPAAGQLTAIADGTTEAIAVLDITTNSELIPLSASNLVITLAVQTSVPSTVTTLLYIFGPEEAARRTFALPILRDASSTGTPAQVRCLVRGAPGVRVYGIEILKVDEPTAERLAQAFMRGPATEAAEITYRSLGPVTGVGATPAASVDTLRLTAANGDELVLPIARYDAVITPEEGAATIIYAGQPFDAEQQAERVVLERLARKAVAAGGARR